MADVLKVPQKDVSGKTKFKVIKVLSAVLEDLHDTKSHEELSLTLKSIKVLFIPPPLECNESGDECASSSGGNAQGKNGQEINDSSTKPQAISQKVKQNASCQNLSQPVSQNIPNQNFLHNSMFRREFRIIGQICEVSQEDKLSYVSLKRQVETGLERGYSEKEIVNAIINAISPGLQICSYLEGSGSIPLARLRKILRSYYKEGSSSDLYQQLLIMSQNQNEEPVNFLLRAMDCKKNI